MSSTTIATPLISGGLSCARCFHPLSIVGIAVDADEDISHVEGTSEPFQLDAPICEDCMNATVEMLKAEIAAKNHELSMYTEALFELEQDRRSGAQVDDESQGRLLAFSERDRGLNQELESLRAEESLLLDEMRSLLEESRRLDVEETKLHDSISSVTRTILDSDESLEAVNRKLLYCQNSLRRLKRMSLLDEAFDIFVPDSGFASINGLRVGQPGVPWNEINAGLGFICLLVDVLVKRATIALSQYRLLPRGSYSVIIKKSDKSVLELFADDAAGGISRFLTGRKFDAAMTAFVQIVGEMVVFLQRDDRSFSVPFLIDDIEGKVGGLTATLQFNSDESWNRAVKMLFANIKCLSTYIDSKFLG
jgi:beclin 1